MTNLNSKIEWTDSTWNVVTGCTKVSPGCDRCYAETITERWHGKGSFAEVKLHPDRLDAPLKWRKPRRVFVNSMSDLFHDAVPDEFIARAWAVMAATPQHTYQILTKRHGRMRSLLSQQTWRESVSNRIFGLPYKSRVAAAKNSWDRPDNRVALPLPNVWLGISAEDHQRAEQRIPALLETPAAVRFISAEPLLGSIDLTNLKARNGALINALSGDVKSTNGEVYSCTPSVLDWIIVGGESGPGFRPLRLDWARCLRDQCKDARRAFFFKQVGGRTSKAGGRDLDGRTWDEFAVVAS